MARGLSLFLGLILALATAAARRHLDLAVWCVDLRPLPALLRTPTMAAAAVLLVAFALYPAASRFRRWATLGIVVVLGALSLHDCLSFYALWHAGRFHPAVPVPLSLFVAAALGAIANAVLRPRAGSVRRAAATALVCGRGFPVLLMVCFGSSDYRRPADAALVFGARAYADGRPSAALEDRVRTACSLYREGLVHELILSGGQGDGPVSEPEAMRQVALAEGVPDSALLFDGAGNSTEASVDDVRAIADREGLRRVIAVSHAYHLPRVKLELQRAGLAAVTVPAREQHVLFAMPWFIAREVAAYWLHLLDLAL